MLRIHEVALELVGEVVPLIEKIGRCDPDLARQLRKSVTSCPMNIAEGSDQIGRRRKNHYCIALGSERETWSGLRAAETAKYIPPLSAELKNKFDHVIGTLHLCIYGRQKR
jgi:four helix bundle protein